MIFAIGPHGAQGRGASEVAMSHPPAVTARDAGDGLQASGAKIARATIAADALALEGTPWHHQGRLPGIGMDCVGAIAVPAARRGLPTAIAFLADERCRRYDRQPNPRLLLAACADYLDVIDDHRQIGVGDILLMRFEVEPQHFALLVSLRRPRILHASYYAGRVVVHGLEAQWPKRVIRAYRYRDTC